jgi:hypothetical protein
VALRSQGEARVLLGRSPLGEMSSPCAVQEGCWCAARSVPPRQSTDPFKGAAATTTEAGTGSKTSAGALDRGGRGRTSGYRGAWLTTNTGAPCGGPDFEGSLDACDALERRATSAGARPGHQGDGTARGARGQLGAARRRVPVRHAAVQPSLTKIYSKNLN